MDQVMDILRLLRDLISYKKKLRNLENKTKPR